VLADVGVAAATDHVMSLLGVHGRPLIIPPWIRWPRPTTATSAASGAPAWTVILPVVGAIVGTLLGAVIGYVASIKGVTRQLRDQNAARAKDLAKEKALRNLDFALAKIERRRTALYELLASATQLVAAVGAFATQTSERATVGNDVMTARTACWGALNRVGNTHDEFGRALRSLLEGHWVALDKTVSEHGAGSTDARTSFTRFMAQARVVLMAANKKLAEFDGADQAAWQDVDTSFTP
jgi:hypothetical protein